MKIKMFYIVKTYRRDLSDPDRESVYVAGPYQLWSKAYDDMIQMRSDYVGALEDVEVVEVLVQGQ